MNKTLASALIGVLLPAEAAAADPARNPAVEMFVAHRQAAGFMMEQARRRGRYDELRVFAEKFAGKKAFCTLEAVDQRDRFQLELLHYDALPAACARSGRKSCVDGEFLVEFDAEDLKVYRLALGPGSFGRGLYHQGPGVTPFPVDCLEALHSLGVQLKAEQRMREGVVRAMGARVD